MSLLELLLAIEIARIKVQGHKYDDVKRGLKTFYSMQKNPEYSYKDLEEVFDRIWSNTIEIIPKEELK